MKRNPVRNVHKVSAKQQQLDDKLNAKRVKVQEETPAESFGTRNIDTSQVITENTVEVTPTSPTENANKNNEMDLEKVVTTMFDDKKSSGSIQTDETNSQPKPTSWADQTETEMQLDDNEGGHLETSSD